MSGAHFLGLSVCTCLAFATRQIDQCQHRRTLQVHCAAYKVARSSRTFSKHQYKLKKQMGEQDADKRSTYPRLKLLLSGTASLFFVIGIHHLWSPQTF